jgi:UTP--glucose-1-phosphate uridylyltransferase
MGTLPSSTFPLDLVHTLKRFHADRIPLDALRERLRGIGDDLHSLDRIAGAVEPPPVQCAERPAPPGSRQRRELEAEGTAALRRGELGVVILAGGMATRFGSTVKALATLPCPGEPRFLDVKLADARRWNGAVPITLMTSFATHDPIARALGDRSPVMLAPQFVSLRVTPMGELFLTRDGIPSPHSTGHGDLPEALQISGVLAKLRQAGVRTALVSNVDNVGATIDPALYAMHRRSGAKISVELVAKAAGDRGGLPVLRAGRLVLAETFRLPGGFPDEAFPLFNTNTLWVDLDALEGRHPWTWCPVTKKVDGREAIQFERLLGELTWWNDTRYLHVERDGAGSRFVPIKEREDLARSSERLRAVIDAQREREREGRGRAHPPEARLTHPPEPSRESTF